MAGAVDLVEIASRQDTGAVLAIAIDGQAIEGRDWKWILATFRDLNNDPIDFSGCTFAAGVYAQVEGTKLVTVSVTGDAAGALTVTATAAGTAGAAGSFASTHVMRRACWWECKATLPNTNKVVQLWGPNPFYIAQQAV